MNKFISKEIGEFTINIYGTSINPLFKAIDIAKILGLQSVKAELPYFLESEKIRKDYISEKGIKERTTFLTPRAVYKFILNKDVGDELINSVIGVVNDIKIENQEKDELTEYWKKCTEKQEVIDFYNQYKELLQLENENMKLKLECRKVSN